MKKKLPSSERVPMKVSEVPDDIVNDVQFAQGATAEKVVEDKIDLISELRANKEKFRGRAVLFSGGKFFRADQITKIRSNLPDQGNEEGGETK